MLQTTKITMKNVNFFFWILEFLWISVTTGIDTSQCIAPLGMENGSIKDEDITASSSFDSGNVGPQHGRLKTERNGGAWCPKLQATTEPQEWLEVDLRAVHLVTGTSTQGRFGNGQGVEFAEAYVLEYWRPRLGKWVRYRDAKGEEVISGNINTYLEAKHNLEPPIWVSKIRFLPYSYHRRTVCMRVELYGCRWTDGIISYSMPQGDKRGAGWEFFDAIYDGYWDTELRRGLGQLTDGKVGPDNFKLGYYENDRTQGWVGWRNDTRAGKPIEIKFEFDRIREFSEVHIYCNNQFTKDVQVFSEAKIFFSVGGRYYNGEPITYSYIEDHIFENSRNISIKLHHRVGKFVKLQLYFAAKWIMISEIVFESVTAHGNFTTESNPVTAAPPSLLDSDVHINKNSRDHQSKLPISTSKYNDPAYMATIVGSLAALILVLGVGIYLIVKRFRQRKYLSGSHLSKCGGFSGTSHHLPPDSLCAITEKTSAAIAAYGVTELDDCKRSCVGSVITFGSSTKSTLPVIDRYVEPKVDDYQEPYQALRYAPYYSYSSVVMEMQDMMMSPKCVPLQTDAGCYDYVVPEMGTMPLLSPDQTSLPLVRTTNINNAGSDISRSLSDGKRSPTQQDVLNALKKRLEEMTVPEFPRHRLRMLSKLSEGAFGTVYIAEADGIAEYSSTTSLGKRLVAIKFLVENASEKERKDFYRDVRILAALEDCNIARVLGLGCSDEEPLCVVMEYLDHGDLCQFLKTHVASDDTTTAALPYGVKSLSFNCLLYMGAQIASGMRYLESLNFVHRDIATRNCLIGKAYQIKICDFGTDNELYAGDYYKVDGNTPLPIRWMAWESVFLGKYTTKSDVWAFAITLWEILTLCRRQPYDALTDPLIMENLTHMHCDDGLFMFLSKPVSIAKDIYDLLRECWRRKDSDRPSFREIHLFLQRKNLGYAPT